MTPATAQPHGRPSPPDGVATRVWAGITVAVDDGVILLDLPDHDSIRVDHKVTVDKLVQRVDVLLWVLDPQKYAQGLLHRGYLKDLRQHAEVQIVALNQIDTNLNKAIDARDALKKEAAKSAGAASQAKPALARLNHDINNLVNLKIHSDEGALVYPPRLRSWLTSISAQISMALVPPTPAMVKVADGYVQDANAGALRLQSDVAAADKVLHH